MKKRHRGRKRRQVLTHAGEIAVVRVYWHCSKCKDGNYPVDDRIGIEGRYSPQAQRLICLAAGSWSYDVSSDRLEEFCGLKISDTTIREVAQEHGAKANEWLRTEPEAVKEFREAVGVTEFTTDGTSVNTREGWREMKVGIFVKRKLGQPATPDEWATRILPRPLARIPYAAIEASESFGPRSKAWAKRLGLADISAITVLADGAKWIWEEQRKNLTQADGVLDIFHAIEHLTATSKALLGDPDEAKAWAELARHTLLHDGWTGIEALLKPLVIEPSTPPSISAHRPPQASPHRTTAQQTALDELRNYLAPHAHHLNYAERLREGRSIGSGQIEGACKNMIGRRLKANAARWRTRRVNRMAGLCSLLYSDQWNAYWTTA